MAPMLGWSGIKNGRYVGINATIRTSTLFVMRAGRNDSHRSLTKNSWSSGGRSRTHKTILYVRCSTRWLGRFGKHATMIGTLPALIPLLILVLARPPNPSCNHDLQVLVLVRPPTRVLVLVLLPTPGCKRHRTCHCHHHHHLHRHHRHKNPNMSSLAMACPAPTPRGNHDVYRVHASPLLSHLHVS